EASKKKSGRPSKVDLYSFFCGVLYVLRTGLSWRDLPACFGNWHTIYTRFKLLTVPYLKILSSSCVSDAALPRKKKCCDGGRVFQ
ncbi:MAG: transposase, partial [Alphaproteobacteria bacterium]